MVYLEVKPPRKRRKSHSMQTFEQIKLVKTRIWYSCLNKLIDMYVKSSGAGREAGSPEGWIFPHFLLAAVLTY